jgi:hypothetical protein
MTIEDALRQIADDNGLYSLSIGMNLKQREQSRFVSIAHYDGHSNRGHGCVIEHGSDAGEALANALNAVRVDRTDPIAIDATSLMEKAA